MDPGRRSDRGCGGGAGVRNTPPSYFLLLSPPQQYNRFTLQPEEDGTEFEVKMSDSVAEDDDLAGASPSFRQAPQGRRNICYLALGFLLIFLSGKPRPPVSESPFLRVGLDCGANRGSSHQSDIQTGR